MEICQIPSPETGSNHPFGHEPRIPRPGLCDVTAELRQQRLNVIGALLSSGRLMMAKLWHSVNGLWFFGFLMALIERVKKPMVVILDNASIHTAKALEPYWELLKEKGMRFYFLPAYSPELNRIEILWKKMKLRRLGTFLRAQHIRRRSLKKR